MTGIYILALLAFVSGLKVTEVAHDFHAGVRKYVTEDLGLLNSYDTWHGNIASMLLSLHFSMSEMNRDKECSEGDEEGGPRCSQGRGENLVHPTKGQT